MIFIIARADLTWNVVECGRNDMVVIVAGS